MFLTCSCQVASALTSQQQERCPNDPSKAEEPLSGQFSTPFAVPFVNATFSIFELGCSVENLNNASERITMPNTCNTCLIHCLRRFGRIWKGFESAVGIYFEGSVHATSANWQAARWAAASAALVAQMRLHAAWMKHLHSSHIHLICIDHVSSIVIIIHVYSFTVIYQCYSIFISKLSIVPEFSNEFPLSLGTSNVN